MQYQVIIDYFILKLLLGLTETPERLYSRCISLFKLKYSLRNELQTFYKKLYIVPFRYYGIYDGTVNYDEMEFKNGKYNDKELEEALMLNKRG